MKAVEVLSVRPKNPQIGVSNFDVERILEGLPEDIRSTGITLDLSLIQKLPFLMRKKDQLWLILIKEERNYYLAEISLEKPEKVLGCAIDLGSTTIAFYFYDFIQDKVIYETSIYNPQIEIGDDILTRLHFARKPENLSLLRKKTLDAMNEVLRSFGAEDIFFISLCGNTAMTHFLLELPVNYLIIEPYVPVISWIPLIKAKDLGFLVNPSARAFIFPLAGTYFGGDLIAGLFEVKLYRKKEISFYLDVGTNAEVVLGNSDFLLACAGAAGPALEGGIFECGLKAQEGAIEDFWIDNNKINYRTIGFLKPSGFCGSAIIKLMAELYLKDFITPEGKINLERASTYLIDIEGERAILLVSPEETEKGRPIYIKEAEIKSFLRSKGAMFTILQLLTEKIGITFDDVYKFYVAGSFGNHIDVESAVILGMLPEAALQKTESLGNAAGKGALRFLRDPAYDEVRSIVEKITYLELNVELRFMELLTGALIIPHVNLELFPWVKKLKEEKGYV